MKKIASLAIAAALVLGASAQSEAAVSGSGYFMATGEFRNNADYAEDGGSSNYKMYERLQLTLLGQSENVTANFTVRVPNYGKQEMVGGYPTKDGYTRGSQLNPQLRIASLTFNVPHTPVSVIVGQHPFAFPGFENPLFDASFPGIQVKAALSSVTPTFAYWLEDNTGGRDQHSVHVQVAVALNDSTMLTPYGGFTDKLGGGVSYAGLVFDTNIDTIAVGASTIYKMQDSSSSLSNLFFEGHFAIDLGMMRPGILAWYGMEGADGSAAVPFQSSWSTLGSFGGWNNCNDIYNGGQDLSAQLTGSHEDPFTSFGVIANVSNIKLASFMDFGAHVMYVQQTNPEENVDADADFGFGAELVTKIYSDLSFVIDANCIMPLQDNTGMGTSLAGTIYYTF